MKKYSDYLKLINNIEKDKYSILELSVAYELKYAIEEENFTEAQKDELLDTITTAYLKAEDISIEALTRAAVENAEKIFNDKMSIRELIEEACWV